ncbi:MAG: Uma2 family endonuclease [Bacteroidia bacterium]
MSYVRNIDDLLQDPELPAIVRDLTRRVQEEEKLREEYYALVHEDCKAEFINGEIIYQSPVRTGHWAVSMKLSSQLHQFVKKHDLGMVGVEKVMIKMTRNNYEPDICFFNKEKSIDFKEDQMIFPVPDFVVEIISKSTEKVDRGIKFKDYALHGVSEYWLIDPGEKTVEQYLNHAGQFQLASKIRLKGELIAEAVPGFSVDISGLW